MTFAFDRDVFGDTSREGFFAERQLPLMQQTVVSQEWMDGVDELVAASYELQTYADNTVSRQAAIDEAIRRRTDAIHAQTGVKLKDPFLGVQVLGYSDIHGIDIDPDEYVIQNTERQMKELAVKFPEHAVLFSGSIMDDAHKIVRDAEARHNKASANPALGMTSSLLANVAGGGAASLRDPVQLATFFAGAAPAAGRLAIGRVAKVMATEAVINAGVEIPLQVKAQAWRKEAGADYGLDDAVRNVGVAALFGAGVGGAVQGAREMVKQVKFATGREISPEGEKALERALSDTLEADDFKALFEEVPQFLGRDLGRNLFQYFRAGHLVRQGVDDDIAFFGLPGGTHAQRAAAGLVHCQDFLARGNDVRIGGKIRPLYEFAQFRHGRLG